MNRTDTRLMELALRKQQLQFDGELLRQRSANYMRAVEPWLSALDTVAAGVRWVRRSPEWPIGIAVALLVARPRAAWRWIRRTVVAWRVWRKARSWIGQWPDTRNPS